MRETVVSARVLSTVQAVLAFLMIAVIGLSFSMTPAVGTYLFGAITLVGAVVGYRQATRRLVIRDEVVLVRRIFGRDLRISRSDIRSAEPIDNGSWTGGYSMLRLTLGDGAEINVRGVQGVGGSAAFRRRIERVQAALGDLGPM